MKHFLLFTFSAFAVGVFGLASPLRAQNVGIGEAAPAARLEIQAADAVSDVFRIDDSGGSPLFHIGPDGDIYLAGNAGAAGEAIFSNGPGAAAAWGTIPSPLVGGIPTRVAFFTSPTSLGHNASFYWDDVNLRLGIGVAAPTEELDVAGDVQFSGALMPGGDPGLNDRLLRSNGAGLAPEWGPEISLTRVRRYNGTHGVGYNANVNYAMTLTHPDINANSAIAVSYNINGGAWPGCNPFGFIIYNVNVFNGGITIYFRNATGCNLGAGVVQWNLSELY